MTEVVTTAKAVTIDDATANSPAVPPVRPVKSSDAPVARSGRVMFINSLCAGDLQAIQNAFIVVEDGRERNLAVTQDQFCELMAAVLSKDVTDETKGSRDDYLELFAKIDISQEGIIDWDQICSFLLLEYYDREDRVKATQVPQWQDLCNIPLPHKDYIVRMMKTYSPLRYVTVSKEGLVCFMDTDYNKLRQAQIVTKPEEMRSRDLWVTSSCLLPNLNKIAIAMTNKEIHIYDMTSKQEFECNYKIHSLAAIPLCIMYWYSERNPNNALLAFGDAHGHVNAIFFHSATTSLFDKNMKEEAGFCYAVSMKEVIRGDYASVEYLQHKGHSAWVRQIQYVPMLDCFITCSTTTTDSMVLGWVSEKEANQQMRTSTFQIELGVNAFDYHQKSNLIATAGINNQVCLWNPYVVSKPVGVLRGHMQIVLVVCFIHAKSQLISLSRDNVLRIWDVNLQICLQRLTGVFPKVHDPYVTMLYDQESASLFTTFGYKLVLLKMKTDFKERVTSHDASITSMVYNDKFHQLITTCEGSCVTMWFVDSGQRVKQFKQAHGEAEITAIALDDSKTRFMTGSADGTIKIWDLNGHCHNVLVCEDNNPCDISAIMPLKRMIIAVGWCRIVTTFNSSHMKTFYIPPSAWKGKPMHPDDIYSVAFNEPHTLATGGYNGEVILWNIVTENSFKTLSFPNTNRKGSATLPSLQKQSRTKSARQRKRSRAVSNPTPPTKKFSVADASMGETRERNLTMCGITEEDTIQEEGEDSAYDVSVSAILFLKTRSKSLTSNADIISCHANGVLRFWNTLTAAQLAEFAAYPSTESLTAAVDDENKYLVTGNNTGLCRVWDIENYCIAGDTDPWAAADWSHSGDMQPPPLLREIHHHIDLISSILLVRRNGVLLVITGSCDCAVTLHTIHGRFIGVFGQEEHWYVHHELLSEPSSSGEQEAAEVDEDPMMKGLSRATSELNDDKPLWMLAAEMLGVDPRRSEDEFNEEQLREIQTWNDTLLGVTYQEERKGKRGRKQPDQFQASQARHSPNALTYKYLNTQGLNALMEIEKPDFIKNPDKYYNLEGVKVDFTNQKPLTPLHIDSDILKVRHDAKSIGIFDVEQKARAMRRLQQAQQLKGRTDPQSRSNSRLSRGMGSMTKGTGVRKESTWNKGLLRRISSLTKSEEPSKDSSKVESRLAAVKEGKETPQGAVITSRLSALKETTREAANISRLSALKETPDLKSPQVDSTRTSRMLMMIKDDDSQQIESAS